MSNMKKTKFVCAVFATLTCLGFASSSYAELPGLLAKYYTCQYDGGHDACVWQYTGDDVAPANPTVCVQPGDGETECQQVVDARGKRLGNGPFCGEENHCLTSFPGVRAFLNPASN